MWPRQKYPRIINVCVCLKIEGGVFEQSYEQVQHAAHPATWAGPTDVFKSIVRLEACHCVCSLYIASLGVFLATGFEFVLST